MSPSPPTPLQKGEGTLFAGPPPNPLPKGEGRFFCYAALPVALPAASLAGFDGTEEGHEVLGSAAGTGKMPGGTSIERTWMSCWFIKMFQIRMFFSQAKIGLLLSRNETESVVTDSWVQL